MVNNLRMTLCFLFMIALAAFPVGDKSSRWQGVQTAWAELPSGAPNSGRTSSISPEYAGLKKSIEITIESESANLERLKKSWDEVQDYEKAITTRINAFKIQVSAYGNMLMTPVSSIKDIENARTEHRGSMDQLAAMLKDIAQKMDGAKKLLAQADEQYALNQKQLAEINMVSGTAAEIQNLVDTLQIVTRIIIGKIQWLENIITLYAEIQSQAEQTHQAFTELSGKFDQVIAEKQKEALFKRKYDPLMLMNINQMLDDLRVAREQLSRITEKEFWLNQFRVVKGAGGLLMLSCVALFILIQVMLFRMLQHLKIFIEKYYATYPESWLHIILRLFYQSLPLLGTVAFIYIYAHARTLWAPIPLIRAVCYLLISWLMTCWPLHLICLLTEYQKLKGFEAPLSRLKSIIYLIRYFAVFHLMLEWLIGFNNVLLFIGRGIFEALLLSECIRFWRKYRKPFEAEASLTYFHGKRLTGAIVLSYGVVIGGILMDVAGYGSLALYWYKSWGVSLALVMWCLLLLLLIREWNRGFKQIKTDMPEDATTISHTIRWFSVQVFWIILVIGFIVGLLFAWGAKQTVIVGLFRVLGHPMPLGGVNISILGLISAIMLLLATHGLARIWKFRLIDTFLSNSGFEPGVKNSIKIITTYLVWTFGILTALNFAGISTTSLTVVFGALGIGLGFGLQNIFNNFISGLILLFERPIQVGDVVEIGGTWGEVKKINVRSTLVQTYNNASLIIPNSEFISKQVTNWSFKDPRVRRIITLGVAYGSDIHLVKTTLLEAVDNVPEAYKHPAPSVIFSDYSDSALVFLVRFWSHVDTCLTAESEIRFEINRLFHERNIEIPFPQRDVHLYTHEAENVT